MAVPLATVVPTLVGVAEAVDMAVRDAMPAGVVFDCTTAKTAVLVKLPETYAVTVPPFVVV
jgi:hypothetical protein